MSESFTTWTVHGTFFGDARTEAIEAEFGAVTGYFVMKIWNELYERKSHRLGKTIFFGKAKALGFDRQRAEQLLEVLCSTDIGYLTLHGEEIGSDGVDARVAKRAVSRDTWRNKKRQTRDNPKNPECPSSVPSLSPGDSPTPPPQPTPTPQDLKDNGAPLEPPDDPRIELDPEIWASTENQFLPDSQCQSDTRFVGAGRKPLKKYPEIWLTRMELYHWIKTYIDAGVPKNQLQSAFLTVQSKLLTYSAEQRRTQSISAFSWGIGFVLVDTLQKLKASTDFKRSQKYLAEAGT